MHLPAATELETRCAHGAAGRAGVAGSRYLTYEKYGYDQAMRTQIDIGVMSYAGLHDVRSQFFYEVDDDLESHEEHLRLAYDLGKTFLATQRA